MIAAYPWPGKPTAFTRREIEARPHALSGW